MKIKEIEFCDIGSYQGYHKMVFTIDNRDKNIVLIGGKNGAGKTTLFNIIKLSLYGSLAYGYGSLNSEYFGIVNSLINRNSIQNQSANPSVSISILMEDGKYDHVYKIVRSWKYAHSNLKEIKIVFCDSEILIGDEIADFESSLLQQIPPELFDFYFFDGEQIAKFTFGGKSNNDFKKAFLKLSGLDTFSFIIEKFEKQIGEKKIKNNDIVNIYNEVISKESLSKENLTSLLDSKQKNDEIIVKIEEKLALLEKRYSSSGGISRDEFKKIQSDLLKEETKREELRKWLKEAANEIIPFIILKDKLRNLRDLLIQDSNIEENVVLNEVLSSKETQNKLTTLFKKVGIEFSEDLSKKVADVLKKDVVEEPLFKISKREMYELLGKINSLEAYDTNRIKNASKLIDDSIVKTKTIKNYLKSKSIDGVELYEAEKSVLLQEKAQFLEEKIKLEQLINQEQQKYDKITSEKSVLQKKYFAFLKECSVNDVSAKIVLSFREMQKKLLAKYIKSVQDSFAESFKRLINKEDLIDGILINSDLEVFPIKMQMFSDEEKEYMQMMDKDVFISSYGEFAYERFLELCNKQGNILLPVEVKQHLSSGEKQVFLMSLYQALVSINRIPVPYVIDTPFARIDTEHRQNIIRDFFMKLKGQVIILSTDEEIKGKNLNEIDAAVSNKFLLIHQSNGSSSIAENTYF